MFFCLFALIIILNIPLPHIFLLHYHFSPISPCRFPHIFPINCVPLHSPHFLYPYRPFYIILPISNTPNWSTILSAAIFIPTTQPVTFWGLQWYFEHYDGQWLFTRDIFSNCIYSMHACMKVYTTYESFGSGCFGFFNLY